MTLKQSSATDPDKPHDRIEHSHRAIERPDVIESVPKGVNQCKWRVGEERGGYGPSGSEGGSLIGGELHRDLGHGRLDFWENKCPTDTNEWVLRGLMCDKLTQRLSS